MLFRRKLLFPPIAQIAQNKSPTGAQIRSYFMEFLISGHLMVMKPGAFFLFFFLSSFTLHSQEEINRFTRDSIRVREFLSQVDHVELCELKPICGKTRCYYAGAIRNYELDSTLLFHRRVLNNPDDLFKTLIASTQNTTITSGSCYEPRNGILFFDKDGNLLSYLEICFTCGSISKTRNFGIYGFNNTQYKQLETIFIKKGLRTREITE